MSSVRVWFLHLYSCLSVTDLEILYRKMGKLGFLLVRSNSWADCFEVRGSYDYEYKVVPAISSLDSINSNQWKLIEKNNKYYVFVQDEQHEIDEKNEVVKRNNYYISEVMFLFAFPICIFPLLQQFNIFDNSVLPDWLNWLFIVATGIVYLGHIGALFTLLFQVRNNTVSRRRETHHSIGFMIRFAISCLVNFFQIVIVIIGVYGIGVKI